MMLPALCVLADVVQMRTYCRSKYIRYNIYNRYNRYNIYIIHLHAACSIYNIFILYIEYIYTVRSSPSERSADAESANQFLNCCVPSYFYILFARRLL